MANVFLDLPVPAANGVGAAVDTSSMGKERTITVQGAFSATITIEISNDGGLDFVPLVSFANPGKRTLKIAAQFMRVRVSNLKPGTAYTPNVDVGCNDAGGLYVSLPVTPGDGVGASTPVGALGTFNTAVVTGDFTGQVVVQISEDGADWVDCFTFASPDHVSKAVVAQFMRTVRTGSKSGAVGTAEVDIGAVNDPTGGGGGGGGSGSNCLIFRPGSAAAGPVVFGTWAGLVAQLAILRAANNSDGCYAVAFDDSLVSPAVVPAGAYDMTSVEWRAYNGQITAVDVADGATFAGLRTFVGEITVEGQSLVTPAVTDLANNDVIRLDAAQIDVVAGGAPFYRASGLGGGDFVAITMVNNATIGANPAAGEPVIDFPVAGTFLFVDAQNGGPQRRSIEGVAGAVLIQQVSTVGGILGPQSTFLGTTALFTISPGPQRDILGTRAVPRVVPEPALAPNDVIYLDASFGPIAQSLPPSADLTFRTEGRAITVVETSGTAGITVVPSAGESINGVAAGVISVPAGGSVRLTSDGAGDWTLEAVEDGGLFNVFVFRPGGIANKNVFTSFAAVTAAMAAVDGVKWLLFDDSIAAVVLPVGTFDMSNVIWGAVYSSATGGTSVTVPEGCVLTSLRRFAGTMGRLDVLCSAVATVPMSDFVGNDTVVVEDDVTLRGGAVPLMEATGLAFDESVTLIVNDRATIGDPVSKLAVIDMPAPGTSSLVVDMRDESVVHDGALATGAAVTLIMAINSPSALVGDAQAGILGPRLQFLAAKARFNPNPAPPLVPAAAPVVASVNDWIRLDVSGGAMAQGLPDAGQVGSFDATGQMIVVKETSGTVGLTVSPAGGDTIDGVAGPVSVPAGGSVLFISDGVSDWSRIGEFGAAAAVADLYSPPEKWSRQNIGAGTPATAMSALVSTIFDDIQMIRAGSVVGINARLNAALTAGSCTVTVRKNGVAGALSASIASPGSSARATQAAGIDTFVAGDLISIEFSTGLGTTPTTSDLEAWLDLELG